MFPYLSMIFSENRYPLFWIMLYGTNTMNTNMANTTM